MSPRPSLPVAPRHAAPRAAPLNRFVRVHPVRDVDALLTRSVRNFAAGELLPRLRQRPAVPLLRLLGRRLSGFDVPRQDRRTRLGRRLADRFAGLRECPGAAAKRHTFWVFPVRCPDPDRLIPILRRLGYDATVSNQLRVVPGAIPAENAARVMQQLTFLPAYPEMPDEAIERLADAVLDDQETGASHE